MTRPRKFAARAALLPASRANLPSTLLPALLSILLAAACAVSGAAQAADDFVPKVVESRQPIDVRNLHIADTTQVGVARIDIDAHAFVGATTLNATCSSPVNLSLDAYESLSNKDNKDNPLWSFDLPTVRKIFATEMEKAGYPRYDPDLSLFESRLGSDADYRIAVTFTKLEFKKCGNRFMRVDKGSAYVAARIELYSQRKQKTVFDKVLDSSYKMDDSHPMQDRDFNRSLIGQLADNLLSDPDWVAAFRPVAVEAGPAKQ